jgi:hypothetical protein
VALTWSQLGDWELLGREVLVNSVPGVKGGLSIRLVAPKINGGLNGSVEKSEGKTAALHCPGLSQDSAAGSTAFLSPLFGGHG